ncbi:MAG: hypothetical protein ACYTFI_26150 [Planctomycetota bacterium]|jgi:hypothetical protein
MGVQASAIPALVTATLSKYRRDDLTDLTTDVQEHVALSDLMKKHRMVFEGGEDYEFIYQDDLPDSARATTIHDDDVIVGQDDLGTGNVPIRHFTTNTTWSELEKKFNAGPARIVDYVKARKNAAIKALHRLIEEQFWGKPATSSNTTSLWGVDYWITYPSVYSADGFVGGNPSGFSGGCAGIDSTSVPRYSNYYGRYTYKTYEDLGLVWSRAVKRCRFVPITPTPGNPVPITRGQYAGLDVTERLGAIVRSQNDNWGNEVAAGQTSDPLFHRIPVKWVPQLDAALTGDTDSRSALAAYDPIYGINWGVAKCIYFTDEWLHHTLRPHPPRHRDWVSHWDLSANMCFEERRSSFMLSLAI